MVIAMQGKEVFGALAEILGRGRLPTGSSQPMQLVTAQDRVTATQRLLPLAMQWRCTLIGQKPPFALTATWLTTELQNAFDTDAGVCSHYRSVAFGPRLDFLRHARVGK